MQTARKRGSARLLSSCFLSILALLLLLFPAQGKAFWPFTRSVTKPPATEEGLAKENGPETTSLARKTPAVPVAPVLNEAEVLRGTIQNLAADLFRNLGDADPETGDLGKGVLVCTFVELKKLSRTSSFGRYLAEQLMGEMQQRRYEVVEIRKSQAVLLQEKRGEFGLSRNPADISQAVAAGAMLTGTYTQSRDSIVINARIIDNRSAKLLSSATAIIPRNQLAEQLLADTASVREARPEPIYLKKLEL